MNKETLFRNKPSASDFPLYDCHVHLGASDTGELYYPDLTGEEYLQLMAASNVAKACAFAPFREEGYRDANKKIAVWAQTTGGRILAFARLGGRNLPVTSPQLWMIRRKVSFLRKNRRSDLESPNELKNYQGVKLLPHLDGLPAEEEFEAIAELGLPVLIHGGRYSSPLWIEKTILPKIRTPLIIAHLGAFPCEEKLLREAVEVTQRNSMVYLDTSGVWLAEFIRHAVGRVPEKLIFGSDAPLAHPLVAWQHLSSVVKDDKILERVGRGAFEEIFG